MERWPAYVCGRLTVLDVDGAHRNILHEPHVQQVAAHLRRLLDERSGESPSGT
jgi:thioesterase domain-containing protein